MDGGSVAVSLIQDCPEAILFSVLPGDESYLRSILVKGTGDLIPPAFPRLEILYCQNPMQLTSTQLVGNLFITESGPMSICASVLPVNTLEEMCRFALTYDKFKAFLCMYSEVFPSLMIAETSANKDCLNSTPIGTQLCGKTVKVDKSSVAAVEILLSSIRERLLQLRTPSVQNTSADPEKSYETPMKPAQLLFLEPNPLLDQWLRGLWSLRLDPQTPALAQISERMAKAGCTFPSPSTRSMSESPDTDTSVSSFEVLRDDVTLLIDAKLALLESLYVSQKTTLHTFQLQTSELGTEYGMEMLWPCTILAEALGCHALLTSLLIVIRDKISSVQGKLDQEEASAAMGLKLVGEDAAMVVKAISNHFNLYDFILPQVPQDKEELFWSSPLTDKGDESVGYVTPYPRFLVSSNNEIWTSSSSASASNSEMVFDAVSTPGAQSIEDDSIEISILREFSEAAQPHSLSRHTKTRNIDMGQMQAEVERREHFEKLFDQSSESGRSDDDEVEAEEEEDDEEVKVEVENDNYEEQGQEQEQEQEQEEENGALGRYSTKENKRVIEPLPSDFEPAGPDTLLVRNVMQTSSNSLGGISLLSSTSFRDNSISRAMATYRVQPFLKEKKAQQAARESEKSLRSSRLKSVEMAQRMARLGWNKRTNFASARVKEEQNHATVRQSWTALLESSESEKTSGSCSFIASPSYQGTTPKLPESAVAAQRRAAQRVKERSRQLMTHEQVAELEKKERKEAVLRERDKRIKLFVERQKGGRLYLMSTGSSGVTASPYLSGYAEMRNESPHSDDAFRSGYFDVNDEHDAGDSDILGMMHLATPHNRHPWDIGSPDSSSQSRHASQNFQRDYRDPVGYFTLREPCAEFVASADQPSSWTNLNNIDHETATGSAPPPPPPLSNVSITVLRARNLTEGLGGCNPYVVLDWSYLGRQSTEPCTPPLSTSLRSITNPSFDVKLLFKPPFLWAGSGSGSGLYDLDRELDGKEVLITTPSKAGGDEITSAATLCAPLLRVYVFSRNLSVSDELLGEGEVDVETMLFACQQGVPFSVELFDTIGRKNAAGTVEMKFEL